MNPHPRVPTISVRLVLLAFTLVVFATTPGATAQAQTQLTLGVVPQFPAVTLIERWQPLIDVLEDELDVSIELMLAPSIPAFELEFLAGRYDLAFMNPYHVVMAHQAQGYQPLVSDASRQLSGILVVPAQSDVETVADLDGTTIAFPAPNAFGASLYMRALLRETHGIDFTPAYVETHGNSYRHALVGRAAAAGGVMNTFMAEEAPFREQFRVLYQTPGVTPHPIVGHPRVPRDLLDALTDTILGLADREGGAAILAGVQLADPFEVSYVEHYEMLQQLNLEAYLVTIE